MVTSLQRGGLRPAPQPVHASGRQGDVDMHATVFDPSIRLLGGECIDVFDEHAQRWRGPRPPRPLRSRGS
jgi:hypothetical protein